MKCRGLVLTALGVGVFACSADPEPTSASACAGLMEFRFEHGADDGHADPFGAKAAGQARVGRIRDAAQIIQGPLARHKARVGDFALANDRIALYIEAEGRASGYAPFGGEIIAIEPVGDDGRPRGLSEYGETLITLSRATVKPDKVSVIADGSDGKAAILRVSGVLANVPFFDTFKALSAQDYTFPAALDYVLEPGAEKVLLRLHVANTTDELVDFENQQKVGFFHSNRSKVFTEANGFGPPKGDNAWVAYDSGGSGFLFRSPTGPLAADLEISGFRLFTLKGLSAGACEKKTVDYLEIATGAPGIDGVLEARRRAYGEAPSREIRGVVQEEPADAGQSGAPLGGVFVHATAPDGRYLTRALTDAHGEFVLHVPQGPVSLTPTPKGWAIPTATLVDGATVTLSLPARATIEVKATDTATSEPLPVRVQILPAIAIAPAPPAFGLRQELDGRLWQDFAITGTTLLPVPPGEHRVIVSRGYEYELFDTPVTAEARKTVTVDAKLQHSVDTSGVMCADFHVHSFFSVDSADPVEEKVKGAIVDGLDIPVSSEHEWVVDFQPVVQKLGLTRWAFGVPSQELTTFTWGHFGVVPLYPREDQPNNGAIDWVGKMPPAFFHQVAELPEKPVFIVNHPNGAGFSYFTAAGLDRIKAAGDPELWSDEFGAIEVFNDSDLEANREKSVADWFALLNAGKTFWTVGSSDSHDQRRTFVGYPRTCLRFGHDDPTKLTPEAVRDVLRTGAATVSGGLYITVEAPSGVGPGGSASAGAYKVVVQSTSWFSATSLEVIVDGVTSETIPLTAIASANPGKRYEATVNVVATQSRARHWVVFHAKGEGDLAPLHPGKKPFAVTNPIFF